MTSNQESNVKVAFATCVQLGLSCIEEVLNIGGHLHLLITLPDEYAKDKSGRIYLDKIAQKAGLPLLKTRNINSVDVIEQLKELDIDWLFIIGWSQIAKRNLLEVPRKGCIGMHPTLLPEGRGRAAIPWAILKGLEKTGVTMFKLDEGMDTGDIIGQEIVPINSRTDASELYSQMIKAHVKLINRYWDSIMNKQIELFMQDENKASTWPQRTPNDGEILSHMTIEEADKLVKAVTHPYPGAFLKADKQIIRIWKAITDTEVGKFKLADGYITPLDFEIEEENEH